MGIEGDEVLLSRVRDDGDVHAFGCLYERHAPAARRFALSLCRNDADADDLTAEVFTALLASLRRGKGPSQLVLPYVFASIRHRHWRTARRLGHEAAIASAYEARTDVSETTDLVEADVVRTALATLPDDVRLLLWRTEVADESVDEVVERNGTSAHNVAVRRHRARRALGTAYLAQHAEPDGGLAGLDAECQATLPQLAALVRNRVGVRRRRRIQRHLAACASCTRIRDRLALVNTRLRAHPPLPWGLWTAGLPGWLGTSAVTVAGSGALAVAVLVPSPVLVEQDGASTPPVATVAPPVDQGEAAPERIRPPMTTTAAVPAPASPVDAGQPPIPSDVDAAPAAPTTPAATDAPEGGGDDGGDAAPPDPKVGHDNGQGNANGRRTPNGNSNGVANGNVRGGEADAPDQANGKALAKGHDKQIMTPAGGPDSGDTAGEAVGPPGP